MGGGVDAGGGFGGQCCACGGRGGGEFERGFGEDEGGGFGGRGLAAFGAFGGEGGVDVLGVDVIVVGGCLAFCGRGEGLGEGFWVLDVVKVEEWAWGEGITILAVLEARESLETRAVQWSEGLANSTHGGLVECRSHHEGLIDGFKCNDRTNRFDGQEIVCVYCCFLSSTNNPSISIHDHNTRRMSVIVK